MTFQVTIWGPNLRGPDQAKGTFHAHEADCKDNGKLRKKGYESFTFDAGSRLEVAEEIYPRDQFEWDSPDLYVGDIHFAPCLKELTTLPQQGSILVMAFELSRGGAYTSETGETFGPIEAMRAARFSDEQINETRRIARDRFGWKEDAR